MFGIVGYIDHWISTIFYYNCLEVIISSLETLLGLLLLLLLLLLKCTAYIIYPVKKLNIIMKHETFRIVLLMLICIYFK